MGCCESETSLPYNGNTNLKPVRLNPKNMHGTPRDANGKELLAWGQVKVPNQVLIKVLHEYSLEYIQDIGSTQDGDAQWCCNGVEIYKSGCKSGQEDLGLHEGIKCWRSTNSSCDFDLCEHCI